MSQIVPSLGALPPLRGLVAFQAVMDAGSFVGAAAHLNISPSAVSHQIRLLESILQKPLFERRNRRVYPTEMAVAYHKAIADGFGRIATATRKLTTAPADIRLTIHSAPSFATNWLMPRLPSFIRRYPELDVTLSSGISPVRMGPDGFLIDIQHMSRVPEACDAIDLAEELIVPLASPAFISSNALNAPEAIAGVRLIHSLRCPARWEQWIARYAENVPYSPRGMQFDRSFLALTAAADSLGLALESTLLAGDLIKSGRLVMVFGATGIKAVAHRLVYRREDRKEPHIRAFVDWIMGQLSGVSLSG